MKRFVASWLLAVLAVPAMSIAGPVQTCNPRFPNGMRGAFRLWVGAFANPQSEGYRMVRDYQIWTQESSQQIFDFVAEKAGRNGPLQFTFVADNRNPADLFMTVTLHGRGRNAEDGPTAYWAQVWVDGRGNGNHLFLFSTHAYEFTDSWQDKIYKEAADTAYSYLANGWTCK